MFDPTFKEFCMRPSWLKIPTASNMRNSNLLYSVYISYITLGLLDYKVIFLFGALSGLISVGFLYLLSIYWGMVRMRHNPQRDREPGPSLGRKQMVGCLSEKTQAGRHSVLRYRSQTSDHVISPSGGN